MFRAIKNSHEHRNKKACLLIDLYATIRFFSLTIYCVWCSLLDGSTALPVPPARVLTDTLSDTTPPVYDSDVDRARLMTKKIYVQAAPIAHN